MALVSTEPHLGLSLSSSNVGGQASFGLIFQMFVGLFVQEEQSDHNSSTPDSWTTLPLCVVKHLGLLHPGKEPKVAVVQLFPGN